MSTNGANPSQAASREGHPLRVNTIYAIVGHAAYNGCQLGVLVLLAKFASPEVQGQYIFGLAIATPILLLLGFELRGALVADTHNEFSFGTYRALRNTTTAAGGLILAVLVGWLLASGESLALTLLLAGVFGTRICWSLAEVGWGGFQRRERLDLLALSVTLRGLALILPFAALLMLPQQIGILSDASPANRAAAAACLAGGGALLVLIIFDRPRMRSGTLWNQSWSPSGLRALAWQTLPLGLVALIVNLCDTFPRLFIEGQPDGKAHLGYFGALAYITQVGNLVMIQAATAAANRLANHYRNDLGAFLGLGTKLLGLAALLGVGVLAIAFPLGGWLLRVLYTADYARFEAEFRLIVVAHCLALFTNVLGVATTQMRLFWLQVPAQVITLLTTIGAALLLIPGDPLRGAAYTVLVRSGVQFVLYVGCVTVGLIGRRSLLRREVDRAQGS